MKILFTALALFFTTCILAQDINCQDFRNGDFKHIGPDGSITYISRKGNLQTEIKAGMKNPFKLKVKWIDDCTYTLKMKKDWAYLKASKFERKLVIYAKMTYTSKTYYDLIVTTNVDDTKLDMRISRVRKP